MRFVLPLLLLLSFAGTTVAQTGAVGVPGLPGIAPPPGAPGLTLEQLPRPQMPPGEKGPVVSAQVERWRTEAHAYEYGEGVERDPVRAAQLYCRAARYGDAEAQFSLAWMYTNARGIERDEAYAAHLFAAAAEQDHAQAQAMSARLGVPLGAPPPCLQPPPEDAVPPAVQKANAAALALAKAQANAQARAPAAGGGFVKLGRGFGPSGLAPAPPRALPAHAQPAIVRFVELEAPRFKLEPHVVLAVIWQESNFDPQALSPKNAQGLMQLIPDTARRFGVKNANDPTQNMRGGMAYLRWLLAYFEGDLRLALAAYNAGERAVDRYRGVPPYAETQMYVRKIIANIGGQSVAAYDPTASAPSEMLALLKAAAR